MFQNSFQSGNSLEIFDPKSILNTLLIIKVSKDKDKTVQNLYKANQQNMVHKIYDKEIKGYIFEIEGHTTKLRFPKDDKLNLGLIQQYLVFQIYIPIGHQWSLEIVIMDTTNTKRRINFAQGLSRIERKFFHIKLPYEQVKLGEWLNLSIDVLSFMQAWPGQTFRSIESFVIGSTCKLRKIFTMKHPIFQFGEDDEINIDKNQQKQEQDIPRGFAFCAGLVYRNQLLSYQSIISYLQSTYGIQDSLSLDININESQGSQMSIPNKTKSHKDEKNESSRVKQNVQKQKKTQLVAMEEEKFHEDKFHSSLTSNSELSKNTKGGQFRNSSTKRDSKKSYRSPSIKTPNLDNGQNNSTSQISTQGSTSQNKIQSQLNQRNKTPNLQKNSNPWSKTPFSKQTIKVYEEDGKENQEAMNSIEVKDTVEHDKEDHGPQASKKKDNGVKTKRDIENSIKQQKNKTPPPNKKQSKIMSQDKYKTIPKTKTKEQKNQKQDINMEALQRTGGNLRGEDMDYIDKSQKFQTISDPNRFEFRSKEYQSKNSSEYEEEIEENIESENDQKQKEKEVLVKKHQQINLQRSAEASINADSIVLTKNKYKNTISNGNINKNNNIDENNNDIIQDSLENLEIQKQLQQRNSMQNTFQNTFQNTQDLNALREQFAKDSEDDDNYEQDHQYDKYQDHLKKFVNNNSRPFTPPFQQVVSLSSGVALVTKKNKDTVVIEQNQEIIEEQNEKNDDILEVIYDPVLNCYYDPKNNYYYELKV